MGKLHRSARGLGEGVFKWRLSWGQSADSLASQYLSPNCHPEQRDAAVEFLTFPKSRRVMIDHLPPSFTAASRTANGNAAARMK